MDKKYLSSDNIIGKKVIDSNAVIVGTINDISLDLTSKSVALSFATKAAEDIIIEGQCNHGRRCYIV